MEYLEKTTPMPAYLPYPRFLLHQKVNETAKLVYILILDRAQLSQRNEWVDEEGRVYIYYTIDDLAKDSGKSDRTVRTALFDLEKAGLLLRRHQGPGQANVLYPRMPQADFRPFDRKNSAGKRGRKLPPNKNKRVRSKNKYKPDYDCDEEGSL